jgi:hypothetical protein
MTVMTAIFTRLDFILTIYNKRDDELKLVTVGRFPHPGDKKVTQPS